MKFYQNKVVFQCPKKIGTKTSTSDQTRKIEFFLFFGIRTKLVLKMKIFDIEESLFLS